MATTLNTIYPPQVDTFMPSFCYNAPAKVWFNVSSYNEDLIDQIKFIHVSMVDQRNNINVFAGLNGENSVYPQYYPITFNGSKSNNNDSGNKMGYDPKKKSYWVIIPPQVLKTAPYYNTGQYYKIQLRFDLTGSPGHSPQSQQYSNPTTFFYWNDSSDAAADALGLASYSNYNEDNFSEWSTGTLVKPILIPDLSLQRFSTSSINNINPSTDISIAGRINFNKVDGDTKSRVETEQLFWYQIQALDDLKTSIFFDSGKIYVENNEINYKADMSMLSTGKNYQMRIIFKTNNGYTEITDYPLKTEAYASFTNIVCSKSIDEENGSIKLNISRLNNYSTGYLVVRRASHRTDFKKWELVAARDISELSTWELVDNTVESMTGYRYQLQYITDTENYRPVYIDSNEIIHCDFYGSLFSDKNKTLKITFNFQPTNRANAMNRTKVDTLGGQYPIFTQNSKLKYHTYSINGRISSEDGGELFLPRKEVFGNEYYNYRYNPETTSPHNAECQGIKSNNDWLYEREYRDAAEEWLNNGKPKLFRSMTEGNMVVILDSVTMTPDTVLGRRLYDFNATMYEIGDGKSLESIASFGLFNVVDER